jgi:hypothetical protein
MLTAEEDHPLPGGQDAKNVVLGLPCYKHSYFIAGDALRSVKFLSVLVPILGCLDKELVRCLLSVVF